MERTTLERILEVRSNLHAAGTISADALNAIAHHAGKRTILHSAETGCGVTTLLFSHLSSNHTVFALHAGGSVTNVRRSPLLRENVVQFVEGPSQRTLPFHQFRAPLQLVMQDGPHAYPYPDLEYYFPYPHLEPRALLVLDDIEVIRNTALFTRTTAPTFDPLGDDWHQQNYNKRTLRRYDWRTRLFERLPRSVRRRVSFRPHLDLPRRTGCRVSIVNPGSTGSGTLIARGSIRLWHYQSPARYSLKRIGKWKGHCEAMRDSPLFCSAHRF